MPDLKPSQTPAAAESARAERVSKNSIAYNERPDFYGTSKSGKGRVITLACVVAALVVGATCIGPSLLRGGGGRDPASKAVPADPKSSVQFVHDIKEERRLQTAANAHQSVPELGRLTPAMLQEVANGTRKIAFIRVVQPSAVGDRISVAVSGGVVGEIDLNKLGTQAAFTYRSGEVLTIEETVTASSGIPGYHQFNAPDGQIFQIVKTVGAKASWTGGVQ